ncbi:MAG: serine/threonine protein kinase [Phycisphaerae bacterium]|nr:serine/threonine protein kinase [Phycisphaerae bacterium]
MTLSIPNYRILAKVGAGAGSVLYRVECMRTGAFYAIKHVKIRKPEDQGYLTQLKDEYNTGSALDHPVLRKVFELRYIRRRLRIHGALLFMEHINGVAFRSPDFSKPLPELLSLFARAAEGLYAMHKSGFVHADLKPNNMLLADDGEVKLIDFGQSCRMHTAKKRTQGTVDYMAPEQVACEVLDPQTDVFGLGATLHWMVTGKPIVTDMNKNVSIYAQGNLGKRVEQLHQPTMEGLAVCLIRLIQDACNHDPKKRPADMREMRERLLTTRAILLSRDGKKASPRTA